MKNERDQQQVLSDRELLFLAIATSGVLKLHPVDVCQSTESDKRWSIDTKSLENLQADCEILKDLLAALDEFDSTYKVDKAISR